MRKRQFVPGDMFIGNKRAIQGMLYGGFIVSASVSKHGFQKVLAFLFGTAEKGMFIELTLSSDDVWNNAELFTRIR